MISRRFNGKTWRINDMKTLYVRIVITTMFIMFASALIAFVVSNIYYQGYLKPENDKKITKIGKNIINVFEGNSNQDISTYLNSMSSLGFQFYLVDQDGQGSMYGAPFRSYKLDQDDIDVVLSGKIYHGIKKHPWRPFITGFFENDLSNTIGVPIQINDEVN